MKSVKSRLPLPKLVCSINNYLLCSSMCFVFLIAAFLSKLAEKNQFNMAKISNIKIK